MPHFLSTWFTCTAHTLPSYLLLLPHSSVHTTPQVDTVHTPATCLLSLGSCLPHTHVPSSSVLYTPDFSCISHTHFCTSHALQYTLRHILHHIWFPFLPPHHHGWTGSLPHSSHSIAKTHTHTHTPPLPLPLTPQPHGWFTPLPFTVPFPLTFSRTPHIHTAGFYYLPVLFSLFARTTCHDYLFSCTSHCTHGPATALHLTGHIHAATPPALFCTAVFCHMHASLRAPHFTPTPSARRYYTVYLPGSYYFRGLRIFTHHCDTFHTTHYTRTFQFVHTTLSGLFTGSHIFFCWFFCYLFFFFHLLFCTTAFL